MNRSDFQKLVGASEEASYLPVAVLLKNGYACAGNFNAAVNEGLTDTCVLLNAHLIDLRDDATGGSRPTLNGFGEFLEEVVLSYAGGGDEGMPHRASDAYGKPIPLTAIPYAEMAVLYPVAQIGNLLKRTERTHQPATNGDGKFDDAPRSRVPTFLDFNKSEILRLLQTRLW